MLKQRLQQKLLQKLSPQQIQVIKLLEIPTMQLEQRIKKELEENPVLEEGADSDPEISEEDNITAEDVNSDENEFTLEDYIDDDEYIPSYKLQANNYSKDDKQTEIPFSGGSSFKEHIESQLGLLSLDEDDFKLALYLVGNIDDEGYVRRRLDAIADDLAFSQNIMVDELKLLEVLRTIQTLDPAGLGARDLNECLLLQIDRKDQSVPEIALARTIIRHYFDEFAKKHYDKIIAKLNIEEEDLSGAIKEITRLNPKPGNAFNNSFVQGVQQIIPDFVLDNNDGELQLSLNDRNVPELRVSRTYSEMLDTFYNNKDKSGKGKDTMAFVKQKMDSAKWFIDAIRQRQNTLLLTMNAIIGYQYDFFVEGDETLLKPMILKDIAERTGLDISTISRVANSKYIQTYHGIYSLKYFFSEGLATDSGEEVSTREIKIILQETIDAEDKKKPLTDDKLAAVLKERGYRIARRTVAKYREQLNIPVARLRKEIK
ncbi:MAG: RNA polymerase factor sigma-54 [Bacteroidales bacterium]|jgi:RNA polymerase sigma-54 factor|nr:RNA polymerase factor sigma-54 [Bacteroidales bacterium]